MNETPPKEGAGQADVGAQAEGAVDRHKNTDQGNKKPAVNIAPESRQRTGEENNPAANGDKNHHQLQPESRVFEDPVTRGERLAYLTLAATAFLAVGTAVLAIATLDMAHSTRKLAEFAKQQAHDTQDALSAARRQATAAEEQNRPWLNFTAEAEEGFTFQPEMNTVIVIDFHVQNIGHSIAESVRIKHHLRALNVDNASIHIKDDCLGSNTAPFVNSIMPNDYLPRSQAQYSFGLTAKEVNNARTIKNIDNKDVLIDSFKLVMDVCFEYESGGQKHYTGKVLEIRASNGQNSIGDLMEIAHPVAKNDAIIAAPYDGSGDYIR